MQPASFFIHTIRRASVFILHVLLLCLPFGCAGSRHGTDQAHAVYTVDVTAAYNVCVAVCSENTSLALVTRTGCLEGCAEARRSFPTTGKSYASRQDCLDALARQTDGGDRFRELREWCDAQWTHVHNRKGCRIAAETFYANLSPASMCGSDGETLEAYGTPPARSLPETSEPAVPTLQEQPVPATAMPAPEAPAAQPPETPRPEAPLTPEAPGAQTTDPDAPVRSTQPAGPLIPPPYTPKPSSQAVPKDTPAPLPAIRDTPKYQKSSTAPSRAPSSSGRETPRPAQPVSSQSPAAKPAGDPTMPPAPEKASATAAPSPSGTVPQASSGQTAPAPATPAATPTEQPVEPVTQPAPQQQDSAPAPSSLLAPPPTQSMLPAKTPEPIRRPLSESETTPDAEASTPQPTQGQTVPGLNANRPQPPSATPSTPASEGKGLTLPVPSMLDRPYNTPTIITPQIEIPPEK